jgi:hypothetical protein
MFPEFRERISRLKQEDEHFARLFNKHNDLDQQIRNIENRIEPPGREGVDGLKKEKLRLKDELYQILKKAAD